MRKLLKHEFKDTSAQFLPLIAIVIGISIINRILSTQLIYSFIDGLPSGLSLAIKGITRTAFVVIIFSFMIITFALLVQRFYKNLLKDEGYLMFTLPVKPWQHILTKSIAAFFWTTVAGLVMIFSILLIIPEAGVFSEFFEGIGFVFTEIAKYLNFPVWVVVLELVLSWLLLLPCSYFMVYASICIGQRFSKNRVLGAFLSYFALSAITQIITTCVLQIFFKVSGLREMFTTPNLHWEVYARSINGIVVITGLLSLLIGVAYFFIANYHLTHKLNLE